MKNMIVVTAILIIIGTLTGMVIKGRKKFSDVPASIREQVKQILIDLDCAELAE